MTKRYDPRGTEMITMKHSSIADYKVTPSTLTRTTWWVKWKVSGHADTVTRYKERGPFASIEEAIAWDDDKSFNARHADYIEREEVLSQ